MTLKVDFENPKKSHTKTSGTTENNGKSFSF